MQAITDWGAGQKLSRAIRIDETDLKSARRHALSVRGQTCAWTDHDLANLKAVKGDVDAQLATAVTAFAQTDRLG